MTTYILTAPNGKEVEIDSPNPPTQELANQVFAAAGINFANEKEKNEDALTDLSERELREKLFSSENAKKNIDSAVGAVSSFAHGGSFGFADKLGGAANALLAPLIDVLVTDKPYMQAVKDRYNEIAATSKSEREDFAEKNPGKAAILELAGAFANPFNKAAANYVMGGAKALPEVSALAKVLNKINAEKGFLPRLARSVGVGGAEGVLNSFGNAETIQEAINNSGRNIVQGMETGVVFPLLGGAVSGVARMAKKGYGIGKKTIDSFFPSAKNLLNASEEEIEQTIKKHAPAALGDFETLGAATRQQAKSGLAAIDERISNLYRDAYKDTDMFGSAVTFNTKETIESLLKELDKKSRKYLTDIADEISENINPTQLQALKRQVGRYVADGRLGLTPNQESRLYDAMKQDVYTSVMKNARRFRGPAVEAKLTKADALVAAMAKPGSAKKILEGLSKDSTSDSTIGKSLFNSLSNNNFDRRKMMYLRNGDGSLEPIKDELIALIRDKNMFNKLGTKGKQMVYGESLPEFEKLFNNTYADILDKIALGTLNRIDRWGDKSNYLTPYLADMLLK